MIVRINDLRKGEKIVVCAHRLCFYRFFITFGCLSREKKFSSKRYVNNERPYFIFCNKLLIKFYFLYASFTGCIQRYNSIII